jgi:pilus assembly protein CpaC
MSRTTRVFPVTVALLRPLESAMRNSRRLLSCLLAVVAFGIAGTGAAAATPQPSQPGASLAVAVGSGDLVRLPESAVAVFVADPDIADVHVPTPGAVFVLGKKSGTTTLFALGENNRTLLKRTIVVRANVSEIDNVLAARFPTLKLSLVSAPGSLMVSGEARTASEIQAVLDTVTPFLKEKEVLINQMTLTTPTQVRLQVRVVEVSRTVTQQLGINWSGLGGSTIFGGLLTSTAITDTSRLFNRPTNDAFRVVGGYNSKSFLGGVGATLDILDQEGLVTTLAEPNLTTLSGKTANFLAGGEFPIPVAQQNNVTTIDYKNYGVSLDFTPTVLADNRISLQVRPEVSALDLANTVTTNGVSVPGLTIRRLETTVEMSSGESFAIGGLLQSTGSDVLSQLPGLGSLPVLGKLFQSKNFQSNRSELVVIVTPYLVHPAKGGELRDPLSSVISAGNDVEYIMQRRTGIDPLAGDAPRLHGPAGFIY